MLFNKPAFKNIVVNELVLDKEGQKMSKSRGNAVIPEDIISHFGVDPLRWYFIVVSSPWVPKRFDTDGLNDLKHDIIKIEKLSYAGDEIKDYHEDHSDLVLGYVLIRNPDKDNIENIFKEINGNVVIEIEK